MVAVGPFLQGQMRRLTDITPNRSDGLPHHVGGLSLLHHHHHFPVCSGPLRHHMGPALNPGIVWSRVFLSFDPLVRSFVPEIGGQPLTYRGLISRAPCGAGGKGC